MKRSSLHGIISALAQELKNVLFNNLSRHHFGQMPRKAPENVHLAASFIFQAEVQTHVTVPKGTSIKDIHRYFDPLPALYEFETDLYLKILATSFTGPAFSWPPSPFWCIHTLWMAPNPEAGRWSDPQKENEISISEFVALSWVDRPVDRPKGGEGEHCEWLQNTCHIVCYCAASFCRWTKNHIWLMKQSSFRCNRSDNRNGKWLWCDTLQRKATVNINFLCSTNLVKTYWFRGSFINIVTSEIIHPT